MKRTISVLLAIAIFTVSTFAFAEEDDGLFSRIGGFLNNVASEAGNIIDKAGDKAGGIADKAGEALNKAGEAFGKVKDAAGDAAEKVGSAASDTLNKAGETAGDTLNKAGEAAGHVVSGAGQSVSDLLSSAGNTAGSAWSWISDFASDQGSRLAQTASDTLGNLSSWLSVNGANAQEQLKKAYDSLTQKLGMAGETAAEVWNAVLKYAAERNITPVVIIKLTIALLVKIYLGRLSKSINQMAEAEILVDVNTIVGWFIDNKVVSQKAAEYSLAMLREFLRW